MSAPTLSYEAHAEKVTLTRLQVLSDLIFALAMFLTVSAFEIPDPADITTDAQLGEAVRAQIPVIGLFLVTLVVLAVYWLKNVEHAGYLRRTSTTHMWYQVLYLGFIVLLPIANNYSTVFPGRRPTQILYSLVILAVGTLSYLGWRHAAKNHHLVFPDVPQDKLDDIGHEALVEPAVAAVSIPLAFVGPGWWEAVFLLIPVIFVIQTRLKRRARARRDG